MKVVFMGTPEFAVTVLDSIIKAGHQVVGVVTTPDKPAGRGQHLRVSDVKQYALDHELPILQPEKMKDEQFIQDLKAWNADVFVVVAFRMLPQSVYTIPPKGTFNVHASLLPQYRGAAPIQWAIINGETETGVTTFFLDEHTDTGAIIRQNKVEITPTDNAGTLHDKLMVAGAQIAKDTLSDIEHGTLHTCAQKSSSELKPAPKIFKEDMHIQWNDTAENIYNKIRGLSPYPAAHSLIGYNDGEQQKELFVKIYECEITDTPSAQEPGQYCISDDKRLTVCTKNWEISIKNLQLEGKKRMNVEDFLKGFRKSNYTNMLF